MSWKNVRHADEDRSEGDGAEAVRRWYVQAQVDFGQRRGATNEELTGIQDFKDKVRRIEDDVHILSRATVYLAGELDLRGH